MNPFKKGALGVPEKNNGEPIGEGERPSMTLIFAVPAVHRVREAG